MHLRIADFEEVEERLIHVEGLRRDEDCCCCCCPVAAAVEVTVEMLVELATRDNEAALCCPAPAKEICGDDGEDGTRGTGCCC